MSVETVANEEQLQTEALTVIEQAKLVKVTDQESYDGACSLLLDRIKPFRLRWKDYWYGSVSNPGPIRLANQAKDALMAKFNERDNPAEQAERQVKEELARWTAEQERKRQELQRQAEAEARRLEEEARAVEAAVAEDSGASPEEVEAITSAPILTVASPVQATYQKANGLSMRDQWGARVVDIKKLCAAVAKGTVPVSYVEPNMVALNARAKADKNTMNVPGVVAINTPVVAGRAK